MSLVESKIVTDRPHNVAETFNSVCDFIYRHSKAGDWRFIDGGTRIRHITTGECPLCWMASKLGLNPDNDRLRYWVVAPRLGMKDDEGKKVAVAADWPDAEGRQAMTGACRVLDR